MKPSKWANALLLFPCLFASLLSASVENPPGTPPVVRQTFKSIPVAALGTPATAVRLKLMASSPKPLNMKILVLASSADELSYQAIATFLGEIGIPYDAIILSAITPDGSGNRLSTVAFSDNSTGNGLYQGIILTNSPPTVCNPVCTTLLSTADWSVLDNYAIQYGVRLVTYYTWPDARWGLVPADSGASYTPSNPLNVTITNAGASVFAYLNSTNPIPVAGSGLSGIFAYRATPVAGAGETTTPMLASGAYTVAVTHINASGEESLSLTMDNYPTLLHSLAFNYGVINWVTKGVFLGSRRIYLSPQIDDFLLGNRLYAPALPQCPQDSSCPTMFMTAPDLQTLSNWQSTVQQGPQFQSFRSTFAYNGIGYAWLSPDDSLFSAIKSLNSRFGWISHTWSHTNLDCYTTSNGTCKPATQAQSLSELSQNIALAATLGITIDPTGLASPFNSGLSNRSFLTAATQEGIQSIVFPIYPPTPNVGIVSPLVPAILEVPREYTNLFDDVESPQTGVPGSWPDEFNARYGPNGVNPSFDQDQTYGQILDSESDNMLLLNMLTYQDYMLGFHIANNYAYDGTHSLYSDLMDAAIAKYQALCTLPVMTLDMRDLTPLLDVRANYGSSGVTGVYTPGVSVALKTVNAATIPITGACSQTTCANYGGQLQDNVIMAANSTVVIPLATGQTVSLSSVSVNPATVVGGNPSTGTVALSAAAPADGISVGLSSDNSSATVPASAFVNAGSTTAAFSVGTTAVAIPTTGTITASYNGVNQTAPLAITPPAVLSAVSLNPTSVPGGTPSTGTVTLSTAAPAGGTSIALASDSSSATVPGTVVVPAGSTTALFTVTTSAVASSTSVTITAGSNGANKTASLTITPGVALSSVSLNPASVIGGNSSSGTVTLSAAAPTGGIPVALASNSASATVPAGVTVQAGSTIATFTVTTKSVTTATAITITGAYAGVNQTASLSITPVPALSSLSLNPTAVAGGVSTTGTVTLSAPAPTGGIWVGLWTSNSSYATAPPNVVVAAGSTIATFTVTTKTVTSSTTVTVYADYSSVTSTASLTIAPALALSSVSLNPTSVTGGNSSTGTVTLSAAAPAGGISIALSGDSPSATVPTSVNVAAGSTTAPFTVATTAVTSSTTATITATYNGVNRTASLTITTPAGLSSVSLNPTSVTGGNSSTGTVTLSAAAPAGGISIALSGDSSPATVPTGVTVAAGNTTATFVVATAAVTSSTTATITATYNGVNRTAPLTINPSAGLSSVSLNPTSVTGGSSSTGTVTLSAAAPTGGTSIGLSSNSSSATVPATVSVKAGSTTATFTVTTKTVAAAATATITASLNGVNQTAPLTITPAPALSSLALNPSSAKGGSTSTGTVTLSAPAPAGGIWVGLWTSNSSYATAPANVVVAAGSTTATFTVTTKAVTSSTAVTVYANYSSVTTTAPLTVTP